MSSLTYEQSKSIALKTILLLGFITIIEVVVALVGKGHINLGFKLPTIALGLIMIALSLYKAIKIVFEFMHMSYEVPAMVKTVLLPLFLLVWGVIAFLWEGAAWKGYRQKVIDKNEIKAGESQIGSLEKIIRTEDLI